ncbi:hypothetical protein GIB67_040022 [Kingdonia uniflora]|uniref:Uncharacterized protein n=1 Tax=Kingdonia uniflora TaxID=39325 RepID=A0A7J7MUZ2_9MAGN|nr:hypothetical protein GIB67_040022 [Kingdonia uniflora]
MSSHNHKAKAKAKAEKGLDVQYWCFTLFSYRGAAFGSQLLQSIKLLQAEGSLRLR